MSDSTGLTAEEKLMLAGAHERAAARLSGFDNGDGGAISPLASDAEAFALVIHEIASRPRESRQRILAALRAFFPGEWPGDRS